MARLIKVKNPEDRLKEKKKVRYLFNIDRTLRLLQLIVTIYIAVKMSQ